MTTPRQITLEQWDSRYAELLAAGLAEPFYGGPLRRHADAGDLRLCQLLYDDSPASLRLWNFLLTEEQRLGRARRQGKKIVGTMKDLGTVPVMAYSMGNVVAFYPDGAWWVPCIMSLSSGDLQIADRLGMNESFCPVRAMLGAFMQQRHFPRPDLLTCSVGATCDDFSSISQRLESLGYPILWWEALARRRPEPGEPGIELPGGFFACREQVDFTRAELARVRDAIAKLVGRPLTDDLLVDSIAQANAFRRLLDELRVLAYTVDPAPLGALEMLIAEMLAIHFCSDRQEAIAVVSALLDEARARVKNRVGLQIAGVPAGRKRVGVYWVNPVADLKAMNLLEQCGGRLCGTEFLFSHALDEIPTDLPPMEALARMALADPMVGPAGDRADRICRDCRRFGAQAVVISRIPGASHCAMESPVIARQVRHKLGLPVVEIEVPPLMDAIEPAIRTRLEALIESAGGTG